MPVPPHHLFPTPTHTPLALKQIRPPGLLIYHLPWYKRMPPGLCTQPHVAWLVPQQQESKPSLLRPDKVLHQTPGAGSWTDIGMEEKGGPIPNAPLPPSQGSLGLLQILWAQLCWSPQTKKKPKPKKPKPALSARIFRGGWAYQKLSIQLEISWKQLDFMCAIALLKLVFKAGKHIIEKPKRLLWLSGGVGVNAKQHSEL